MAHKELKQVTFGDSTNIVKGIPQGSITVSLLLFKILINDLFFFSAKCEICYFADANSLYSCGMNLDNMFTNLNVYEWFVYSSMKANPEHFRFTILGNTSHTLQIGI